MSKFSSEDDDKLIALIHKHPSIYLVKSRKYRDCIEKDNTWKLISKEMKKDEKEIKGRWKNIRDYYQRRRKATMNARDSAEVKKFFTKFANLVFLEEAFVKKRYNSSVQSPQNSDEDEANTQEAEDIVITSPKIKKQCISSSIDSSSEDDDAVSHKSASDKNTQTENQESTLEKRQIIRKKRIWNYTRQEKNKKRRLMHSNYNSESNNPLSLFFKSIELTVATFSQELQQEIKLEIMHLVGEYQKRDSTVN